MRQLVELGYRGSGEALKRWGIKQIETIGPIEESKEQSVPSNLLHRKLPLTHFCLFLHSFSSISEEFEARKREIEQLKYKAAHKVPKILCSAGREYGPNFPFLQALADREEMVRNGKLTSIIFIRDKNAKGQEVSGYIDFAHRLKIEDFTPYFAKKKKLIL